MLVASDVSYSRLRLSSGLFQVYVLSACQVEKTLKLSPIHLWHKFPTYYMCSDSSVAFHSCDYSYKKRIKFTYKFSLSKGPFQMSGVRVFSNRLCDLWEKRS